MDVIHMEKSLLTGQDLIAMGEAGPCELIDGRIVPMSPTGGEHTRIEIYLGAELREFARQRGWVLGGEVGIYTRRDPDTVRGADVAFISRERMPDGLPVGFLEVAPDLVVEIVSPSDRWEGMRQKVEEYFGIGVEQVWIVEPKNHAVLVYTSPTEMQKFAGEERLVGEGILEGFVLDLGALFEGGIQQ